MSNSNLLPEDAWSSEFQTAAPRPLLTSLQRRLQASTTHAHALAELFRERAVVEQEYAAKLAKLAHAAESGTLLGKNGVEWDRRGGEARLWDAVVSDIQETSSSHSTLAAMLRADYEQPVRELPNKVVAWRRIADQEASLDRTLKDQEKTLNKLEKAQHKAKSTKTDQLRADLNGFTRSLASLSPMVYTTFQRLDEERLSSLKEVVVRWSTARADMAARDGERAEASVAKLLSWEPVAEVESVGHRLAQAAGGTPGGRPSIATSSAPAPGTPTRRMSVQSSATGDFTPTASRANGSNSNLSSTGTPGGGGFSGFKSLLSRKATTANRQRSGSEAASTRSSRRPTATADVFESLDERPGEQESLQQSGRPAQRREREPSTTQSLHSPPVDSEGFSVPPADRHRNPWEDPNELVPTPAFARGPSPTSAGAGVALPSAIFAGAGNAAGNRTSSPAAIQEYASSQASSHDAGPPKLNLALASTPIQESEESRQAALAKMQQTLQMAPQAPNRRTTMRGRRGERHTMQPTTSEAPLPANHMAALARIGDEDQQDDDTPLAAIKQEAMRHRSASSQSNPNPFDSPSMQAGQGAEIPTSAVSPAPGPSHAALGGVAGGATLAAAVAGGAALANHSSDADHTAEQVPPQAAASVSQESQLQSNPAPVTAPDVASGPPGLRATIVETVNVHMKENQSQQTTVTGEIFFAGGATAIRTTAPVHVKLTEFDALDSIAPNPAFLAQVPDRPGEYFLNYGQLLQAAQSEGDQRGVLLFQYQVLIPEGSETSIAPVALSPAFQLKDGETRMILHYRVSPGAGISDLDLSVLFPSDPAVTKTQSKPFAETWSDAGENRLVSWKPTAQDGVDGKIIARYVTAPGTPGPVPKSIDARFVCPGRLLSGINVETVDGTGALEDINLVTVSGTYVGEPSLNS